MTNPKDSPKFAKVIKIEAKDVGVAHSDSSHTYGVSTTRGIGIELREGTFEIVDTVESGQAFSGGARTGDYLVGVNNVRLADCMINPGSVDEFSKMMGIAERPLRLNINHITVAKKRSAPAPPMPPAKTGNPMICVFIFCLALSAIVVGVVIGKDNDMPIIRPECLPTITQLGVYPGYVGDNPITGSLKFSFTGTSVKVAYDLEGVETTCSTAGTKGNSCGIHIHEGTSCDTATDPGAHYFDDVTVAEDPWTKITYSDGMSADATTSTGTTGVVEYGYDAANTYGHVFVVHDYDGSRVTCAVIKNTCAV